MHPKDLPTLHGDRVVVRPLAEADIEPLLRIVSEPAIAKWWIRYDAEHLRKEMLEDEKVNAFAIELDGELIGAIDFHEETDPDYRFAMVDVTVDTAHIGQGLGTDALRTIARYLFEERGHHRLAIDPAAANKRAIRAYEKVGFKSVGIMRKYERGPSGEWRDSLLMDLLADELR